MVKNSGKGWHTAGSNTEVFKKPLINSKTLIVSKRKKMAYKVIYIHNELNILGHENTV
jgi:hypothetical protein